MTDRIIEVTEMIQNSENIENDLKEAMGLVQNYFKEKYVKKIHNAVQLHHTKTLQNPPKEVQLLNVMKQFTNEENHKALDNMIDTILIMNSAKNIKEELQLSDINNSKEINIASMDFNNDSIHEDGVYDIDKQCLIRKNSKNKNIIPEMLFFLALTKVI